ncbi:helix-turn-helix domain-containing protein [Mycobacteroides abscessus]|uniref:helix-turn-helix domain-containing protein n=1 Tax=Mycobacteroides abscessus TaxID=36809 RepID=UPI0009A5F77E|nr:helix-turn-helix domain-containing protein [Mycobacteroides abscessus]SLJ09480.1 Helix-turn-helix domain [Mycobacteroides abscessus subsp. abscessus]
MSAIVSHTTKRLYRTSEVSALLGCSIAEVLDMVRTGDLTKVYLGKEEHGRLRITSESVETVLEALR